jgi:hypothetical protein
MKMQYRRRFQAVLAIGVVATGIASLIGSGGGGGGGGLVNAVPFLAITSNNAFDVSSAVIQAVLLGFDTAEVGAGPVEPAPAAAAGSLAESGGAPQPFALQVNTAGGGMLALEIAVGPVTEACDGGGSVTISGNLANPGTLTVGDTLTLQFNNCDDNDGNVLNGRLDLVIRAVQGDPNSDVFLVTADTDFTSLTVNDGTDTFSADGSVTVTLDSLAFPVIAQMLSGSSFTLSGAGESYTLSNFTQTLTVDTGIVPDTKVAEASGTLASQVLDGKVDYETTVPIQATGDLDPEAGEILITGADNTTVTIVIENVDSVRLDIDSDGDGIVDDVQFTTWAALTGQTSTVTVATAEAIAADVLIASTQFGVQAGAVGSLFGFMDPFGNLANMGVSGNFGPVQVFCQTSGSADISGFIAVAGNYSAGDQLDTSMNDCANAQFSLSGPLFVTVTDFQGMPNSLYRFEGNATLAGLQRLADGMALTAIGTLTTTNDAGFTEAQVISVDSSTNGVLLQADGVSRIVSAVTSSVRIDVSVIPVVATTSPSGTLVSDLVGGPYRYEIGAPLVTTVDNDPATGPSSGDVLVTATDDSSVHIVAVDDLNVRLDIDLDGDQVVDEQIFTTWAALL